MPSHPTDAPAGIPGWDRRRLLATLAGLSAGLLALLAGLGYAIHLALAATSHTTTEPTTAGSTGAVAAGAELSGSGAAYRDAVAAAPMLRAGPDAARPAPPAPTPPAEIAIPPATAAGPAGVPTGFPQSPPGAVGQLAAIVTTVLTGMSLPHTISVHQQWTLPGAGEPAGWVMTDNVHAFLATAAAGQSADRPARVVATPAAGLVKGTDGDDWVLACVLVQVRATITATARIGYGHCERMQWQQGRWWIAAGAAPAQAPSTWPGTEVSIAAGWRTWVPDGGE